MDTPLCDGPPPRMGQGEEVNEDDVDGMGGGRCCGGPVAIAATEVLVSDTTVESRGIPGGRKCWRRDCLGGSSSCVWAPVGVSRSATVEWESRE